MSFSVKTICFRLIGLRYPETKKKYLYLKYSKKKPLWSTPSQIKTNLNTINK